MPQGQALTERRYLTVMFSDLVGYTALSERLDPEVLRGVQLRYQEAARDITERYGGFVANYSGDGVLVYFGYPDARESDADRAVRAALEILSCIGKLDLSEFLAPAEALAARIALHSGLVVVGPETTSAGLSVAGAVGEAVNVAARLQAEADPNTVVVSGATHELVEGLFDFQPMGLRPIRGLSRAISLYRVLAARPGGERAQRYWRRGAVRMIGRQPALDRLSAQWQAVTAEHCCRVVQVVGEAGVGKSRLVLEFCQMLALSDRQVLQATCLETFASAPLYPVAGFLWVRAGLQADDSEPVKSDKVVAFLRERGLEADDAIEALASLLGVALTGSAEARAAPAEVKRGQFALVIGLVGRIADRAPVLLWVEDTHWLDPSSAELLPRLIEALHEKPVLVVLTRRSFPPGPVLPDADDVIPLDPLSPTECVELARAVPGAQVLPERTIREIVSSADGVPLFVEQLVVSLVSRAGDPPPVGGAQPPGIPLTLAEMLAARLDRRPGGRRTVQAAACIGRAFTEKFLAALLEEDESAVEERINALVESEIFRRKNQNLRVEFEFRHALLQRVAYESILTSDRRAYHARIVGLLNEGLDLGPVLPEVMAHHLTEASAIEAAIESWLAAGMQAARRSAHVEALDHLERGLGLVAHVSDAALRRSSEIKLLAAQIGSITATVGASSARMSACCRRGLELCLSGESSPLVFPLLFGQFTFLIGRARVAEALELAKLFLALAERSNYAPARVLGHRLVGMACLGLGDAHGARHEVERSLSLYAAERDAQDTHLFGQNAQVHGSALLSLALFCLGETDAAFRVGVEALRSADELRHPHSTAIALAYVGGWVFGLSGAGDLLMQQARQLVRICEHHQLGVFRAFGEAMLGWALCLQNSLDQGIAALEKAIAALAAAEFRISEVGFLAILAEAKCRRGLLPEARTLSERALASARTADRWLEPEALRIAALISAEAVPGDPAALALAREAVACARRLASPVFELRSLETLCRLAGATERTDLDRRFAELARYRGLDQHLRRELRAR
jgi:class 3 adenylate cyclase/tetratricopeptide (TPR) repeat protein